jgi:hypothetical protein
MLKKKMRRIVQLALLGPAVVVALGCTAIGKKEVPVTLSPFVDTYRWHSYHLSKRAPASASDVFRLISVSENGDVEIVDLKSGERVALRRGSSINEIVASKRPIRIDSSSYADQSADISWLTTN